MTTSIIQADIAGSSYLSVEHDYRKLRAVRKFIVRSDASSHETLIAEMRANIGGDSQGNAQDYVTMLGPRWQDPDWEADDTTAGNYNFSIAHPANNDLFLQTTEATSIGNERFLVTANYFIIPVSGGGGAQTGNVFNMRTEFYSKRVLGADDSDGTFVPYYPGNGTTQDNLNQYGQVRSFPQVKLQIPFAFTNSNPISTGNVNAVGSVNGTTLTFAQTIEFGEGQLRYDGVQMTDMGSVVTSGGTTGRYKGVIEYTARGDLFLEQTHHPGVGIKWTRPSVTGTFNSIDDNGFPVPG